MRRNFNTIRGTRMGGRPSGGPPVSTTVPALRETLMNALACFALVAPLALLDAGARSTPAAATAATAAPTSPAGITETPGEFEIARVQKHLAQIERDLLARDTRALTPDQRLARKQHIARIQAYRERGRFPHNHDFPGRRVPCFVDRHGTRDVLAHLMESSGQQDLVHRVSRSRNNATVREMVSDSRIGPDFHAWLVRSGLSVDEAQKLQPSYEGERPVVFGEPSEIAAELA